MGTARALALVSLALALAPSPSRALTMQGYDASGQPLEYKQRKNGLKCYDYKGCADSRHVMWCTPDELAKFPDLHSTSPTNYAKPPSLWHNFYNTTQTIPTCKETVFVADEFATPEAVAKAKSDILAKHPGASKVTWYWAQHQGGIWKCPFYGIYPVDIYYGGGVADTPVDPPVVPPVVPEPPKPPVLVDFPVDSSVTDPSKGAVYNGRMHNGFAAGTAPTGARGMAENVNRSFCHRAGRTQENIDRCLKVLK